MNYKLLLTLAALCVVQGHAAVPRDLAADLAAAEVATEALIGDSNDLIAQESAFYRVVSDDVFVVLQGIIAKLADFGVPQSQLELLLTNISVANINIQTVVYQQIFLVTELIAQLVAVLGDLASSPHSLADDSWYLAQKGDQIGEQFYLAVIYIDNQMRVIRNNIADLIIELTPEQAGEVDAEMARARGMVDAQRDLVVAAKGVVDAGISDLTGQLDNIVSQLPQPQKLDRRAAYASLPNK